MKKFLGFVVCAIVLFGLNYYRYSEVDQKWQAANTKMSFLLEEGKYREAIDIGETTLALAESNNLRVAESLFSLAEAYTKQGNFDKAILLYQRSLTLSKKTYGPEHLLVFLNLNGLAAIYGGLDRIDEAQALHQQALPINAKIFGSESPEVAAELSNLASTYIKQEKYKKAKSLLKKSLKIYEKQANPNYFNLVITLMSTGYAHFMQGQYDEALSFYQGALKIQKNTLRIDPANTPKILNFMGEVYESLSALEMKSLQGKEKKSKHAEQSSVSVPADKDFIKKAEICYQEAVASAEKNPELPPDILVTYIHHLASFYFEHKKYEQAEALFKKALHMDEKIYGPAHPEIVKDLRILALISQEQSKREDSKAYFEQILKIQTKLFGSNSKEVNEIEKKIAFSS